jgi:hypothetical protein
MANFALAARLVLLLGIWCFGCREAGLADAGPCSPSVIVHLSFEPGGVFSWPGGDRPLQLTTSVGTVGYSVPQALITDGMAVVTVPYPPGTEPGAASARFYAIAGGISNYEGGPVDFVADPAACVEVTLPVRFISNLPDAGQ